MEIRLNIIPDYRKEELKEAQNFGRVLKWIMELSAILVIFIILLVSINYILQINVSLANNSWYFSGKNNSQLEKIKKYDSEAKEINVKTEELEKIQKGQISWSHLFGKISSIIDSDIYLNSLSTRGYGIFITGKATNRESLIAFKERLEKETCFTEVKLPLSNLVAKSDIDFQIDFLINAECLK